MLSISLTKLGSHVHIFHIQAWTSSSSYYSSLCLKPFLCSLCCWKLLWATLTLGVVIGKGGMVSRCENVFVPSLFKGIYVNIFIYMWYIDMCVYAFMQTVGLILLLGHVRFQQEGPLTVHPSVWLILFYWWRKKHVATFCYSDVLRLI